MKLFLKASGLSLLALGMLFAFSTAQAEGKKGCDYDLREGAVYFNGNTTPSNGKGKPVQNDLIVFLRRKDGTLSSNIQTHMVKSGGFGNQAGIVTSGQNAVIHTGSGNHQFVFMTNPGFDVTQGHRDKKKDHAKKEEIIGLKNRIRSLEKKVEFWKEQLRKGNKRAKGQIEHFALMLKNVKKQLERALKDDKPHSGKKIDRSGSVSVFKVTKCRVILTDVKSTRGQEPRAVTRDTLWTKRGDLDLVYVVNAGSGEVQFNGCPGLPEGFIAPTSAVVGTTLKCGFRAPVKEFDPTSIIGYKFDKYSGKLSTLKRVNTADKDGDPAQISFLNEGRQLIVAQRNTFFALGDGTEDDIVEVFNLDEYGLPGKPVVSTTTGNDPFGFSVYKQPGKNFNDCVLMSHGSFQQRDQGGVGVFRVDPKGVKQRVIPNKPDGGSDTCWTAISRTDTLYTAAFFDSEISIRSLNNPMTDPCNIFDGGPPVVLNDKGHPMFTADPLGYRHRVTSSPIFKGGPLGGGCPDAQNPLCRNGDQSLVTDQSDFLFEAGGLDMAVSKSKKTAEFLYNVWAPVPFYIGQDGEKSKGAPKGGNFLYPPTTEIAIFRVIEDCKNPKNKPSIFEDGCRVGDLEYVGHQQGLPGSGFGMAAY